MKKYIIQKQICYNNTTYILRSTCNGKNKHYFRSYYLRFIEDDIKYLE